MSDVPGAGKDVEFPENGSCESSTADPINMMSQRDDDAQFGFMETGDQNREMHFVDDPEKNALMNKFLQEYTAVAAEQPNSSPAALHRRLEQVAEVSEEDDEGSPHNSRHQVLCSLGTQEEQPNGKVHHKGISDSSQGQSSRKISAQRLFRNELQRRCESLIIASHKFFDDQGHSCTDIENEDDRQSSGSCNETTNDNVMQGKEDSYDVLAMIRACQERQESGNVAVNYIIDSEFGEEGTRTEAEDLKEAGNTVSNAPAEREISKEECNKENISEQQNVRIFDCGGIR